MGLRVILRPRPCGLRYARIARLISAGFAAAAVQRAARAHPIVESPEGRTALPEAELIVVQDACDVPALQTKTQSRFAGSATRVSGVAFVDAVTARVRHIAHLTTMPSRSC